MRHVQLEEQRDPVRLIMLLGLSVLIGIVGLLFLLATRDSALIKNVLFFWLVLALFLAFLVAGLFTGEIRAPRSKIVLPLAAFVGLAVVSTAVFRYAYAGLHELASLLCGIALAYVAAVTVTDRTSFLTVTAVLGGVAGLSCVYGIAQHFGYDPILRGRIVLPEVGRSLSTMGHPNFFGAFLVLAIPVMLALFFGSRSPLIKAGAGVLVCAALLCLFYTRSRGAWLGFVGALPVWFFLSLPGGKVRRRLLGPIAVVVGLSFYFLLNEGTSGYVILWALPLWLAFALATMFLREKFSGEVRWTAVLLLSVILVSNVFVEGGEIAERADAAFETEKGSVLARKVIWTGALNMFKAKPIFGWGLGRFSIYFPRFRDPATAWKIMPNTLHAHSEYLEVAAEMGIVGLGVFLWAMGAFLWESARNAGQAKEKWRRFAIAGLAAGCLAILIHALD
jgi:O-antigen ligase